VRQANCWQRAQQTKLPSIGLLGASTSSNGSQWTATFVQRLCELGWIEGRTVAIEHGWAQGRSNRFAEIAARARPTQCGRHRHGGKRSRRRKASNLGDPYRVRICRGPGW
jgi:hypothetical protein